MAQRQPRAAARVVPDRLRAPRARRHGGDVTRRKIVTRFVLGNWSDRDHLQVPLVTGSLIVGLSQDQLVIERPMDPPWTEAYVAPDVREVSLLLITDGAEVPSGLIRYRYVGSLGFKHVYAPEEWT